jgi:hypothetical protein
MYEINTYFISWWAVKYEEQRGPERKEIVTLKLLYYKDIL